MSRAVILPTPTSPFQLKYWLDMYERNVEPEVDMLYVHINGIYKPEELEAMLKLCEMHSAMVMFTDHQIEHGTAIDKILDTVTEEHVMLIEDDCFVFKGGFVNKMFTLLENGAFLVIGSKRGSCGNEILEASKTKYKLDYSGLGDSGCNFWPSYFFIATQALRDTDRHFHAKEFRAGVFCEELNHTFTETQYGDTFVNTSIQIMAKYPQQSIHYIPQHHASPDDSIWYNKKQGLFDGQAKYIHVGSLSSFNINQAQFANIPNQQEKREWERRVAFWTMFWEHSQAQLPPELGELSTRYKAKLDQMIAEMRLSISKVNQFKAIYRTLGL